MGNDDVPSPAENFPDIDPDMPSIAALTWQQIA
jgi:hypothetical protein